MRNIKISFNNKLKCSVSTGCFSSGKLTLEKNNKRQVLRKMRGTDGKYHERNLGEVEEDLENIQQMLHCHVLHGVGAEEQGQMAVSISVGLR